MGNQSWVTDICLTGRFFSSDEALRQGLVSSVHDDKEAMMKAAFSLAREIASKSPVATVGIKHVLNYSRDHSIQDGLDYVALWNSSMLRSRDVAVAISSKNPIFSKL